MISRLLVALSFLFAASAGAAAQTSLQLGLAAGSNPRQVCAFDNSPSRACVPIGWLDAATHTWTPLVPAGSISASMFAPGAAAGNLGFTPLNPANNLSDLSSASAARTNLGLGALATQNALGAGAVTSSMLATGAAAANLSTMLPGLTSSVSGTGVPGLSGGHWMIRTNPGTFDPNQTLRVDRVVSGNGTNGGFVYPTSVVNTTTSPIGGEYEWGLLSVMHNMSPLTLGAQNVALQGTINMDVPVNGVTGTSGNGTTATVNFNGGATFAVGASVIVSGVTPSGYNGVWTVTASSAGSVSFASSATGSLTAAGVISLATTGASGTGTTATVTFSNSVTIPVGDSVLIAGMTPSAYNGTWKVTGSSAGSVSFASTATGSMSVAGSIVDVEDTNGWAFNSNVIINNDIPNPKGSYIGGEIDITNNGSVPTTDNGNVSPAGYGERVGLQIQFNGKVANAGSHAGRAILIGTGSGNIWDRGISFQNNYGTGIDFTQATISGPALGLAASQKIALDATAPSGVETFARYLNYNGANLAYHTASGDVFTVSDTGAGTFAGAVQALSVGTSGTPIANGYFTSLTLGSVPTLPSQTANTFLASPNGSSGAPTMRAIVAADLPATLTPTAVTSGGNLALNAASSSTLTFGIGGTTYWNISSGAGADLRPLADNARNLGSASLRLASIHAMNQLAYISVQVQAAVPTISTCGTSPPAATAGSSNNGGQFTLGTGATAACTVTFATAFPNTAFCTVTPASNYTGTYYVDQVTSDKTKFTVKLGTGTASVVFNYSCNGN
jgi:hypothetical protein